jgi:hypothetical protein
LTVRRRIPDLAEVLAVWSGWCFLSFTGVALFIGAMKLSKSFCSNAF